MGGAVAVLIGIRLGIDDSSGPKRAQNRVFVQAREERAARDATTP